MDDARALLNSLMGNDRNARADQRKVRKFTDHDICKNFLLGLCPCDLFKNTKIDLGACDKEHNDFLKESFEGDADRVKYTRKWRGALRIQLKRLLEVVDRRIASNQQRIEREKDGGPAGASEEQKQQLTAIKEEMSLRLREAEQAADNGNFEESRNMIKETEAIKRRIEDLELKRYEKYRKEDICATCGLIIDDEEQEAMKTGRGWHSNGKQHIGYTLIRQKLKEIEELSAEDKRNGIRSPTPSPVREKPDSRRRKASKSRSRRRRSRSRKRRSRSKSRRRRSPSVVRKKGDRKKRASSSSDRRSKSRKRKDRSKSRKRSRSKKKQTKSTKDPSPSKDKSKDKKKEKDKDDKDKAVTQVDTSKVPNKDAETKPDVAEAPKPKAEEPKPPAEIAPPPAPAPAPVPKPPAPAPEPPKDEGARNRKAPVFMVFRPKAA